MNQEPTSLGDNVSKLSSLGSKTTDYVFSGPNVSILETFENQYPAQRYAVVYETTEFTSLCPKTSQPDFGEIKIDYVPGAKCVETKSLKLYLFAFRNVGSFMETIVNKIARDFVDACEPVECHVTGKFAARGGVTVTVTVSHFASTAPSEPPLNW